MLQPFVLNAILHRPPRVSEPLLQSRWEALDPLYALPRPWGASSIARAPSVSLLALPVQHCFPHSTEDEGLPEPSQASQTTPREAH